MTFRAHRAMIRGQVQGVGFRAWTAEAAEALAISGWVRNEPDGTVGALIAGEAEALEAMIAALHEGPPMARVEEVHLLDANEEAPPSGFRILRHGP